MSAIEKYFEDAKNTKSDINEHLGVLRSYASLCSTVTEFGARWGVSTLAFLAAKPKRLISYDLEIYPRLTELQNMAKIEIPETEFIFRDASTLFEEIEPCDLLFLDTYHVYEQVLLELIFHAKKVKKFIIFHDTVAFKEVGQTKGYGGIWKAIEGFLTYNPEWVMIDHRENNNGLTVLAKNLRPVKFWKA